MTANDTSAKWWLTKLASMNGNCEERVVGKRMKEIQLNLNGRCCLNLP